MKLEQSIIIARPIESVFAYRSALENAAAWQRDVLATALDTLGPTRVGTRCTEVRRGPNGMTQEWRLEVTEFEQDRVLGIVGRCGSIRVDERHVFTSDDRDTRYTLYLEMTGSSLPASAAQRKTVETLLNLKWVLEALSVRDT